MKAWDMLIITLNANISTFRGKFKTSYIGIIKNTLRKYQLGKNKLKIFLP